MVDCGDGDTQIGADGSSEVERDAGEQVPSKCVRLEPSLSPWVSDTTGVSSLGSFVLQPTGETWTALLALPFGAKLLQVDVFLRPQSSGPVTPILPPALAIFKGNDMTIGEWILLAETADDVKSPAYAQPHKLTVAGLHENLADHPQSIYRSVIKAPLGNDPGSAIVVDSIPYLTIETEDCD